MLVSCLLTQHPFCSLHQGVLLTFRSYYLRNTFLKAGWSSIRSTQTLSVSAIRLFCFLIIRVFTGIALLISFKNFPFAFTTWQTIWCKRPGLQPVSALNTPSSLSLIIPSFGFKVRDVWLFLSLEHLEAIVRALTGLLSVLCLRE